MTIPPVKRVDATSKGLFTGKYVNLIGALIDEVNSLSLEMHRRQRPQLPYQYLVVRVTGSQPDGETIAYSWVEVVWDAELGQYVDKEEGRTSDEFERPAYPAQLGRALAEGSIVEMRVASSIGEETARVLFTPAAPGMNYWARIIASQGVYPWAYEVEPVRPDPTLGGEVFAEDPEAPEAYYGEARNTIETVPFGNGVTQLPEGFFVVPAPNGVVVRVWYDAVTEARWFQYENGVDGECPP